jgi:hypothetical protein
VYLAWHVHAGENPAYTYTQKDEIYTRLRTYTYMHACISTEYGTLMIVDSEDMFRKEEIEKLERDVKEEGLSVLILAEW